MVLSVLFLYFDDKFFFCVGCRQTDNHKRTAADRASAGRKYHVCMGRWMEQKWCQQRSQTSWSKCILEKVLQKAEKKVIIIVNICFSHPKAWIVPGILDGVFIMCWKKLTERKVMCCMHRIWHAIMPAVGGELLQNDQK